MKKLNVVLTLVLLMSLVLVTSVSAETHIDEFYMRVNEIRADTSSYLNVASNALFSSWVSIEEYLNVTGDITISSEGEFIGGKQYKEYYNGAMETSGFSNDGRTWRRFAKCGNLAGTIA